MKRCLLKSNWVLIFLVISSVFSDKVHADPRPIVVEHQCPTLDPVDSIFYICTVFRSLFSTPILPRDDNQNKPGTFGAYRFNIDTETRSIEFFLHEDARWSNDSPVVAQDYILTIKRILNNPNSQSTTRTLAEDIIGSEFCNNLNDPKCLHSIEIFSPYHFKIFFKEPVEKALKNYNMDGWSPTPSEFWKIHGDSTYKQPNLPTYGVYKLKPTSFPWETALKTKIHLIPDPLSKRKYLQYYSSVTALKRQSWTADLIRERAIEGTIPDVLLNVSGISSKQQEYLKQKGSTSIPTNAVSAILTALLDEKTLEPDLRDAVTLLLDSEEFSSRHRQYSIEPTDRLIAGLNTNVKFSNRFKHANRETRLKIATELLAKHNISPSNKRTLNLIYDLPLLNMSATLVKNILKPYGLNIEIHFFNNFGSSEFTAFREENDIHIELLSWVSTVLSTNNHIIDMYRVSVLDLLSDSDYIKFQKLEQEAFLLEGIGEENDVMAQIDNLLINNGGFAVLGVPAFVSILATDLCFGNEKLYIHNYTTNLMPCNRL